MRPAGRRLSAALSPEVNTADRAASYRARRRRFVCRWYPAINAEVNAVRQINESAVTRVHASLYEHNTRRTARICGTGFEETTNRCLDSYNDAECVLQLTLTFAWSVWSWRPRALGAVVGGQNSWMPSRKRIERIRQRKVLTPAQFKETRSTNNLERAI